MKKKTAYIISMVMSLFLNFGRFMLVTPILYINSVTLNASGYILALITMAFLSLAYFKNRKFIYPALAILAFILATDILLTSILLIIIPMDIYLAVLIGFVIAFLIKSKKNEEKSDTAHNVKSTVLPVLYGLIIVTLLFLLQYILIEL